MENLLKVESSDKKFSKQKGGRARKPKPHRQLALDARRAEPTPPSQGGGTGSNPVGAALQIA